jgi:hypothetical protein
MLGAVLRSLETSAEVPEWIRPYMKELSGAPYYPGMTSGSAAEAVKKYDYAYKTVIPFGLAFDLQSHGYRVFESTPEPFIRSQYIGKLTDVAPAHSYDIIYDKFGAFYYTYCGFKDNTAAQKLKKTLDAVLPLLNKNGALYVDFLPNIKVEDLAAGYSGYIVCHEPNSRLLIVKESSRLARALIPLLERERVAAPGIYSVKSLASILQEMPGLDGGVPANEKEVFVPRSAPGGIDFRSLPVSAPAGRGCAAAIPRSWMGLLRVQIAGELMRQESAGVQCGHGILEIAAKLESDAVL